MRVLRALLTSLDIYLSPTKEYSLVLGSPLATHARHCEYTWRPFRRLVAHTQVPTRRLFCLASVHGGVQKLEGD